MKNNVFTILKKECMRIFSDKKLFFTAVIMPGLLIVVIYTVMGNLTRNMLSVDEDHIFEIHSVNMPDEISDFMSHVQDGININKAAESDIENIKKQIESRETDLLVVFKPGDVQIYGNSARNESSQAREIMLKILEAYHHTILPPLFIVESNDLATEADIFSAFMGSVIVMMLILFIFTGCQSIAPESISGEKERGTLGTLLVTPTKRSDIAFAKILAISFFGFLSATISMVGIAFSLPQLMGDGPSMNILDFFSITDFILLFTVAISTTLVFVSVLSIMSAYSKSVKEANAYTTPFMIVSMLCGMAGMLFGGAPSEIYYYFIPVFNSALSISGIIGFEPSPVNIAVTIGVNLLTTLICVGVLAKIFNSEKIVFDK